MEATERVARFIVDTVYEDLPQEAIRLARQAFLDCIGVTLAGAAQDTGQVIARFVEGEGAAPRATVLGHGVWTSASLAALANGTMAHALDFDDTNHPMYGHPSSQLVPVALALGEEHHLSGREALLAYLVGFEVDVKLSRAMNMPHYLAGWHASGVLGTMGSAAAAARLLKLDVPRTEMALGIAGSLASGVRENLGSMTKPLHAGNAAHNGVKAAQLVAHGFTGTRSILEGQYGFCRLFGGGAEPKWAELTDHLGAPWEITEPYGYAIKPYPACGGTHPAIEGILALARTHDLRPADVEQIRVGVTALAPRILTHHRPATGLAGKFSMEYCMAAGVIDRRAGLEQFTDEKVAAPVAQALMRRVEMYVHPELKDNTEFAAHVSVHLKDGRTVEQRVMLARGKPARPMSREELHEKFQMCARLSLDEAGVRRALELLESLDRLDDLSTLAQVVGRPVALRP